jgi:hypothetical protein
MAYGPTFDNLAAAGIPGGYDPQTPDSLGYGSSYIVPGDTGTVLKNFFGGQSDTGVAGGSMFTGVGDYIAGAQGAQNETVMGASMGQPDPLGYAHAFSTSPVANAANAVASWADLLTNVPRLLTIVLGVVIFGAGLFMLGKEPAVSIARAVAA